MSNQDKVAFYLVENNGVLLDLFGQYNTERRKTAAANKEISERLGVTNGRINPLTGRLVGVVFPKGAIPPEFRKADKQGVSMPKQGTEWEKIFNSIPPSPSQSTLLSKALDIPLMIGYKDQHGVQQHRAVGYPLNECGWLYSDGQLGFWVPNIPAYTTEILDDGGVLDNEALFGYLMEFPGCKRIHEAEWDLIVATGKVKKIKESEAENATA